jgi:hypothetical protein
MDSRRGLGASDPRDMIYAHLGLVELNPSRFSIMYEHSVVQVYEDVARLFLTVLPNLSILIFVENTEEGKRLAGLPSWVPDWSRPVTSEFKAIMQSVSDTFTSYYPDTPALYIFPGTLASLGYMYGSAVALIQKPWCPVPMESESDYKP